MHRAVLLATGPEIDVDAIRLPDGQPLTPASGMMGAASTGQENPYGGGVAARAAQAADAVTRSFVGQTVAAMEKTLILDTLTHCLGNRTHAANILGISIRTLRNKLNEYADEGTTIPAPQSGVSASGYAA
jgi:DNA-binding NtrC family response regulator